jgi:hypothetical protein
MNTVEVSFEKGGKYAGNMRSDLAPKTCEAFWKALPIEGNLQHCSMSGECIWFRSTPDISKQVQNARENYEFIGQLPGTLGYTPDGNHFILVYGSRFQAMGFRGHLPLNTVFTIVDRSIDLDELYKVGVRVRAQGQEKIRITKKE